MAIPLADIKSILKRLGFTVAGASRMLTVTPPPWRTDVANPVDLYEEIARIHGYDALPTTLPKAQLNVITAPPIHHLAKRLRTLLVGAGYSEVLTHSLVGDALLAKAGTAVAPAVALANPLSEVHAKLRGDLATRHLEAVEANLRWRDTLRFFEVGRVFAGRRSPKQRPRESDRLLVTVASRQTSEGIFAELRGVFDLITERLRAAGPVTFRAIHDDRYAPGRGFLITVGSAELGLIAEYGRPSRFKAGTIGFLELDLAQLEALLPADWTVTPPPAFPPVKRDLSVFVPDGQTYAGLEQLVREAAGPLLAGVTTPVEFFKDGRRSLTIHLEFASGEHTLTDAEVGAVMAKVTARLAKHGFVAR
jgi:phenylalanyl-tRNA synthetase beta chain